MAHLPHAATQVQPQHLRWFSRHLSRCVLLGASLRSSLRRTLGSAFFWMSVGLLLLVLPYGFIFVVGGMSSSIPAGHAVEFRVHPGETLRALLVRLEEQQLVRNPRTVLWLARLRGDATRIRMGEYRLQGNLSAAGLLSALVSGQAQLSTFTIPEGFMLREIADRLRTEGISDADQFLRLSQDAQFIASLQLPFANTPSSLEGLLFPETYHVDRGIPAAALLRTMTKEFRRRAKLILKQAERVGLSPYEVVVLASIVERETSAAPERAVIAAVFHNRLKRGMRLESDPTVIYGLKHFDGNLTRKHLRTLTPYNTYRRKGLTPTPISNPGEASMRAVVYPEQVDYLFFVSKGNGTHFFSENWETHQRAVWRYQLRRGR